MYYLHSFYIHIHQIFTDFILRRRKRSHVCISLDRVVTYIYFLFSSCDSSLPDKFWINSKVSLEIMHLS